MKGLCARVLSPLWSTSRGHRVQGPQSFVIQLGFPFRHFLKTEINNLAKRRENFLLGQSLNISFIETKKEVHRRTYNIIITLVNESTNFFFAHFQVQSTLVSSASFGTTTVCVDGCTTFLFFREIWMSDHVGFVERLAGMTRLANSYIYDFYAWTDVPVTLHC